MSTGYRKPDEPASDLEWRVFTVTRPGLTRDVPPGYESLMWVANSATLIYGERDAVLVDTFLTRDQNAELVDAIAATAKNLTHIYITHGHGDHFFGLNLLQERFRTRARLPPRRWSVAWDTNSPRNGWTASGASATRDRYPTSF